MEAVGRPVMQTENFVKGNACVYDPGENPGFHYPGGNFSNISSAAEILLSFFSGLLLPVGTVEILAKFFGPIAKSGLDIIPLL